VKVGGGSPSVCCQSEKPIATDSTQTFMLFREVLAFGVSRTCETLIALLCTSVRPQGTTPLPPDGFRGSSLLSIFCSLVKLQFSF
jgi:hypothetical protein